MSAVVCYNKWNDYDVDQNPKLYKYAGEGTCSTRNAVGLYDATL